MADDSEKTTKLPVDQMTAKIATEYSLAETMTLGLNLYFSAIMTLMHEVGILQKKVDALEKPQQGEGLPMGKIINLVPDAKDDTDEPTK